MSTSPTTTRSLPEASTHIRNRAHGMVREASTCEAIGTVMGHGRGSDRRSTQGQAVHECKRDLQPLLIPFLPSSWSNVVSFHANDPDLEDASRLSSPPLDLVSATSGCSFTAALPSSRFSRRRTLPATSADDDNDAPPLTIDSSDDDSDGDRNDDRDSSTTSPLASPSSSPPPCPPPGLVPLSPAVSCILPPAPSSLLWPPHSCPLLRLPSLAPLVSLLPIPRPRLRPLSCLLRIVSGISGPSTLPISTSLSVPPPPSLPAPFGSSPDSASPSLGTSHSLLRLRDGSPSPLSPNFLLAFSYFTFGLH